MKRRRDYKKEGRWQATREQVKRRVARNRARRALMKDGLISKGDGKEVHHADMNPLNNSRSNLRVVSRSVNRRKQPKRS